ncbi:MAG: VWA domain-containing protein [Proteobacteria bacterium]|nr:VWA domain-containing protein [Pseudomonadota bacterium]
MLAVTVVFALFVSLLIGGASLPAFAAAAEASTSAPVIVRIDSPTAGELVKSKVHLAAIRGSAQSGSGDALDFDVMLTLDVSHSTRYPSGSDVDEDGDVGFNPHEELIAPGTYPDDMVCSDPEDTILAAEIRAAHLLLEVLDPKRTRVGVISFSGEVDPDTGKRKRFDQQDAILQVPLTSDFDRVRRALDEIARRGPFGATNFSAAIQLVVRELAGISGAESQPREGAKKVVLFLTDGVPTFPFGMGSSADPEDTEAAINAARLARRAGIVVNTYALGRHALAAPVAVTEMARITVGSYTPARNPGDITSFLQGVTFANVEDVVITNLTTREVSYDVSLSPDGTFSGFVPVSEGENLVQVTALASDGGESTAQVDFAFEKSGLSDRELALELERIQKRNKELMLLIERERIQRFRDRQRKRVVIEAEDEEE